jgi:CubicO group peptidase (beta-lactamase class C family)
VTTLATGPQGTGPQRRPPQPTLANWQEPPHNRWAFQHVRELVPTARIRRAPGPVRRLAYADQEMDPRIAFSYEKENLTLEQLLADSFTDGFIVLHRGRVVFERYFNGMAPDMPHLLMSVSKSVTAAVAGALAGRAALDVRARVEVVVPELAGTSFAGASVQDLLDMRAGTKFNEDYADLDADVRTYERVYLWRPPVAGEPPDPADATEYFGTLGNDGTHGGPFRYRSILTDVLAWVLERAAGQRLNELVERELWQPMGAEFDADVTVDGHGNPMADGGISATLRDIARFGQLYLQRGRVGRRQVLPAWWVDDTVRGAPDGAAAFTGGGSTSGYPAGAHYRNCWWVRDPALPFFHASGINGQHVFVHRPAELVVAKLSTWPDALSPTLAGQTIAAVHAIASALMPSLYSGEKFAPAECELATARRPAARW